MPHCKWDVSAAIHIHVILADINREDERFLLGASLHIPRFSWLASVRVIFLRRREKSCAGLICWGMEGAGGQDVWPHHSGALSADLSILSTRFRKPFKFVFAVRTDLHDEDKCRLSMRPFISTKLEHIFLVPHFCRYFFAAFILLMFDSVYDLRYIFSPATYKQFMIFIRVYKFKGEFTFWINYFFSYKVNITK